MNTLHFGELRIEQITTGSVPMTEEEREYLVTDTVTFEECQHAEADLRMMSDKDLMNAAYSVWAEYASGQV